MRVQLAYLLVIMIWATTPLSIKLGGQSFSPMAGLSLRILLAVLVGSVICTIGGYAGLNIRRHWKLYAAASLGIFPNMALIYVAADYISSGLISLMFGLAPFFTAVLTRPILGESVLQPRKLLAIALAVVGLVFIFYDRARMGEHGAIGIGLMLLSNVVFSSSSLLIKKLNKTMTVPPMEQALGSMAFSLPGLLITWVAITGVGPIHYTPIGLASLLYLSLFASLVGFAAYYYILNHMAVETVSLIPLITPILAMLLGVWAVDEVVTLTMLAGAGLILVALVIHQKLWVLLARGKKPQADNEQAVEH
ncbi:DMT family transporter [Porticoccus litoralis]|uniref:DMT family transporter n=1 Tax=Porticoccus litoralis TaxID=434086 RepID=A0AAW8B417_9GAMM|nr:DMT family transporter [Porticoccus litoralis]MDP1519868.1 DMT family transporter [Porticoccus litoralis]